MVIPIEEAMANRQNFTPILSVVMVIYTVLCVLSGGLGYMAFGDETEVNSRMIVSVSLPGAVRNLFVRFTPQCPA